MSSGEERVAALLSVITDSGVEVEKLSKLKGYRKLMRLNHTHKTATSSLNKDKCGVNDIIENNKKRNVNSKHDNKSQKCKQDAGANLTDSESETEGTNARYCELSCGAHDTSCRSRPVLTWMTGCCVALIFLFIHQHELLTHHGFSRFWLSWENVALHAEVCTIELPDRFQDIFRPVVDCAMCRNVTHVDKVARLSPQLFEQRSTTSASGPGKRKFVAVKPGRWSLRLSVTSSARHSALLYILATSSCWMMEESSVRLEVSSVRLEESSVQLAESGVWLEESRLSVHLY
ncbi:uncharacterized protein LOC108681876 [Hyalella azteca]|uniref:Uncharacterized protein LOC108681876 n=1 Tax=Hyalella azteca TaxID=294128 RepID=A0A8B7PJV4_HYAAZ|nr:uncharacterized protein LOC108681876 [Hyalella azteca]